MPFVQYVKNLEGSVFSSGFFKRAVSGGSPVDAGIPENSQEGVSRCGEKTFHSAAALHGFPGGASVAGREKFVEGREKETPFRGNIKGKQKGRGQTGAEVFPAPAAVFRKEEN